MHRAHRHTQGAGLLPTRRDPAVRPPADGQLTHKKRGIAERLRAAGCVFADEEALLILNDGRDIETLVRRREGGEPLEHVLGWVSFGGLTIEVDRGVFVPRQHTVALAEAAATLLRSRARSAASNAGTGPRGAAPPGGSAASPIALDLFAGTGAIAALVQARNPEARVVAGELDVRECLRNNCREVYESDVDDGIPVELEGRVDVLTANVPYVPTAELQYVPHEGESTNALDGGDDGLDWVRRVVEIAPRWLTPTGTLFVEVARHQVPRLPEARYLVVFSPDA